jgi:hypothetical protein
MVVHQREGMVKVRGERGPAVPYGLMVPTETTQMGYRRMRVPYTQRPEGGSQPKAHHVEKRAVALARIMIWQCGEPNGIGPRCVAEETSSVLLRALQWVAPVLPAKTVVLTSCVLNIFLRCSPMLHCLNHYAFFWFHASCGEHRSKQFKTLLVLSLPLDISHGKLG